MISVDEVAGRWVTAVELAARRVRHGVGGKVVEGEWERALDEDKRPDPG